MIRFLSAQGNIAPEVSTPWINSNLLKSYAKLMQGLINPHMSAHVINEYGVSLFNRNVGRAEVSLFLHVIAYFFSIARKLAHAKV